MENINYRDDLEKLYNLNKQKIYKLKSSLVLLDKIELNIEQKISRHLKYIEELEQNFKESINSYHTICKNLIS